MNYNSIIHEVEDYFNGNFMDFIKNSGKISLGEFEEKIKEMLMCLGKLSLEVKCLEAEKDAPPKSIICDGEILPRSGRRKRQYFSVFGKIEMERSCYWAKGHELVFPLDKVLCLPQRVYSYPLQELVSFIYAGCTLRETREILTMTMGIELTDRVIMDIAGDIAEAADDFRDTQTPPDKNDEEDVLVVSLDGKGVPMRKDELKDTVGKDGKEPVKKMAALGVVYSTGVKIRTAEQMLSEYDKKTGGADEAAISGKRIRADLGSKEPVCVKLKEDAQKRNFNENSRKVFLADGEANIWNLKSRYFADYIGILDIYHVMEYLWKCGRALFFQDDRERRSYVRHKLKFLFTGKFDDCINELKNDNKKGGLSLEKRADIRRTHEYFENHRSLMRYDEYLQQGLPIGSGNVESACKNLVCQRMDIFGNAMV